MSDKEFGGSDDLSLPKATVHKIVTEILASDEGMSFAKDSRDLLTECCVEFITMISSEANEIAEREQKKTIACEHIEKALSTLGFADYIPHILTAAAEHRNQQAYREKKQSKIAQSGMSEEELLRQQEELFRSATDKFNAAPQA